MENRESLRDVENLRFRFQMNNRLRLESLAALSKVFREFGEPITDDLLSSLIFAVPQELIVSNDNGFAMRADGPNGKSYDRPNRPPASPHDRPNRPPASPDDDRPNRPPASPDDDRPNRPPAGPDDDRPNRPPAGPDDDRPNRPPAEPE